MLIRNIPTHYMEKREESIITFLTLYSFIYRFVSLQVLHSPKK